MTFLEVILWNGALQDDVELPFSKFCWKIRSQVLQEGKKQLSFQGKKRHCLFWSIRYTAISLQTCSMPTALRHSMSNLSISLCRHSWECSFTVPPVGTAPHFVRSWVTVTHVWFQNKLCLLVLSGENCFLFYYLFS